MQLPAVPAALLLFPLAFAAGFLTLASAAPSTEPISRAALPPCEGLLEQRVGEGVIRLRGIVEGVGEIGAMAALDFRVRAVVLDGPQPRQANTIEVGREARIYFWRRDPLVPWVEQGRCLLLRARFQGISICLSCFAEGYAVEEASLRGPLR